MCYRHGKAAAAWSRLPISRGPGTQGAESGWTLDCPRETGEGVNGHRKYDTSRTAARREQSDRSEAVRKDLVGAHHRVLPCSERSSETAPGGGRVDGLGELGMAAHPVAVAPDVDHVAATESL